MSSAAPSVSGAKAGARRPPIRFGRLTTHALSLLMLLIWAGAASMLPTYLLPGPLAVGKQVAVLLVTPSFLINGLYSIAHIAVSIVGAMAVGMCLALLMHFVPATRSAITARLNPFLASFSTVGWVFLAVIWFGLNDFTVVFVVAATLLPFALSNLRTGLEELDAEIIEMGHSFSRSQPRIVLKVLLPLMVPYIFATLRICLGVAWKVVLTAELFGGASGLGYLISRARADFDIPTIFAMIAIIVAAVYVSDTYIIEPLQRRLRRNYAVN
jgi:NitT/TauT family transport system permease protein/sulfonate transport system permease protein